MNPIMEKQRYDEKTDPYNKPYWIRLRKKTLNERGFECAICGITCKRGKVNRNINPIVHHITPLAQYTADMFYYANRPENLEVRCRICHRENHNKGDE